MRLSTTIFLDEKFEAQDREDQYFGKLFEYFTDPFNYYFLLRIVWVVTFDFHEKTEGNRGQKGIRSIIH